MSIKVKCLDPWAIETRLKKEDLEAWHYIRSLKQGQEVWKESTYKALSKIRELVKQLQECQKV